MIHRRVAQLMACAALALVAAIISHAAGASRAPAHSSANRALESAVDAYLAPLEQCDVFQGMVLLARGDHVLLEKGYGSANLELGVPNTPRQVFRIASLSKPFTEVLLGRLVEQHRLALSDTLGRFLPGFHDGNRVTLDMLRTHRAGIPSMNSIPYDEESRVPNTLDSLVRVIATKPLDFEPGSRTRYSNGGYAVLAAVIEKVTGTSYAEALAREVSRPLGLEHTRHESDRMLVPNRAFGYMPSALERHAQVPAPFQQMATKTGGGSLVSTAGDLHRFMRAFHRDNVLRAATWRELFPADDSLLAFQGRCPGYNVYMARDLAHDLDVVVLSNSYASGMVADVGHDLMALARGEHPQKPKWQSDVAADPAECRRAAGTYRAAKSLPYGDGPFGLELRSGGLVFTIEGSPVDYALPQGNGAYLLRNVWSELRITSAADPGQPTVTLRPLWFETKPVALERVGAAPKGGRSPAATGAASKP